MHLYVLTKGDLDSVHRWQADLRAQFLKTYKNGKPKMMGKGIQQVRRLGVRPVQLFEIGFAEEELDTVLGMVHQSDYITDRYPVLGKYVKWLRKLLKLKPVPKPKPEKINPLLQPNQLDKAVAVVPIGLKKDIFKNGEEML